MCIYPRVGYVYISWSPDSRIYEDNSRIPPGFFPASFGPTLMARGSVGTVRLAAGRPR